MIRRVLSKALAGLGGAADAPEDRGDRDGAPATAGDFLDQGARQARSPAKKQGKGRRKPQQTRFRYIAPDPGEVGRAAALDRPARAYAFGSSSTEVLDYIFGPSPRYRSHWAAGWSARGLRKEENRAYVLNALRGAAQQDVIFLHFGVVDALFNAPFRMQSGDFLDPETFCREAAEGVTRLAGDLEAAGFANVHALCVGAPCRVPPNYFWKKFRLMGIPPRYQAQLLNRITELVGAQCQLRDLTPVLADDAGLMRREFLRARPEHHADYTRIQQPVWQGISDIAGLPPHRDTWRSMLYRSGVRGGVASRIQQGNYGAVDLAPFEDPALDLPRLTRQDNRIIQSP